MTIQFDWLVGYECLDDIVVIWVLLDIDDSSLHIHRKVQQTVGRNGNHHRTQRYSQLESETTWNRDIDSSTLDRNTKR